MLKLTRSELEEISKNLKEFSELAAKTDQGLTDTLKWISPKLANDNLGSDNAKQPEFNRLIDNIDTLDNMIDRADALNNSIKKIS